MSVAMDKARMTIQAFAEMIGTMVASFPAVQFGRLFYRQCDNLKTKVLKENKGHFGAYLRITTECMLDLQWWHENIMTTHCPISTPPPQVILASDASKIGWGGNQGPTADGR